MTAKQIYRAANIAEDRTWENTDKRASACVRQLAVERNEALEQVFSREKVESSGGTEQADPRGALNPGSALKSDKTTKMVQKNLRIVSYCEDKSKTRISVRHAEAVLFYPGS